MKNYFSIQQAAKLTNLTSETLRHYDRIDLVKPSFVDDVTQYRYYSEQELIRLRTVSLLKQMGLSLKEIRNILRQDDLATIVSLLKQAEQKADEKIAQLQYAKSKIKLAYTDYEMKLSETVLPVKPLETSTRYLPARTILVSDSLEYPTLRNLWNYHSNFYRQLDESRRHLFQFEDRAGMLTKGGRTFLFAVCLKYPVDDDSLIVLPAGVYLCGNCTEDNREVALEKMLLDAESDYGIVPQFIVQDIIVTGILQWSYEIQLFLGERDDLQNRK